MAAELLALINGAYKPLHFDDHPLLLLQVYSSSRRAVACAEVLFGLAEDCCYLSC